MSTLEIWNKYTSSCPCFISKKISSKYKGGLNWGTEVAVYRITLEESSNILQGGPADRIRATGSYWEDPLPLYTQQWYYVYEIFTSPA